jgi:GNAT superfamily N-acetyltransferase
MSAAIAIPPQCVAPTIVRRARPSDIEAILRVEQAAWPGGECMRADADKFAFRIALRGVFVACRLNRIVGCLTTFRPSWACASAFDEIVSSCPIELIRRPAQERWREACRRWHLPADWHEATADGTLREPGLHRPDGDVVFGVGIATDPAERGTRVAQALLEHALAVARSTGARHFVGYGRLPQYHASTLPLEAYLRRPRAAAGRCAPHDLGLRLHWSVGARPARTPGRTSRYLGIPASMRDDPESRDAGFLIVNPLCTRARFPFERIVGTA